MRVSKLGKGWGFRTRTIPGTCHAVGAILNLLRDSVVWHPGVGTALLLVSLIAKWAGVSRPALGFGIYRGAAASQPRPSIDGPSMPESQKLGRCRATGERN